MKHLEFGSVPTELIVNHKPNKKYFIQMFKEKKALMKFLEPILVKSSKKSEVTVSSADTDTTLG